VTSKVISILMTFADGTHHSLTEIARLSGLPISTAHRLATELAAWGMLERNSDGLYRVGSQLRTIAMAAGNVSPVFHERARRVLDDLSTALRCVARLGVLDGFAVAYMEKSAPNRPVSAVFEPLPAHATAMGKALLAYAPSHLVEKIIDRGLPVYTALTVTRPDRLRRALGVTRLTRLAVARHELDPRECAVAAPVFGAGGAVVAALELSITDDSDLRPLQAPLVVAARSLTRELQAGAVPSQLGLSPRRTFDVGVGCGTGHNGGVVSNEFAKLLTTAERPGSAASKG
jgi:DNA-binding IclR family transcriptional regulator